MQKTHKRTTDDYPHLCARDLVPARWDGTPVAGCLTLGTDTIGTTSVTRDHVTITSSGVEERFDLAWTEQPYGPRARFLCPKCGRRCDLLYLAEGRWCCRVCLDLAYRSSQAGIDHRHDLALAKLRARVGTPEDVDRMLGVYPRKQGQHRATYKAILWAIEERERAQWYDMLQSLTGG